jgi:SAM-dependent methyltransferase
MGKILEVGPGGGTGLAELKRLGWTTAGIEISERFPEVAKELGNDSIIDDVVIGDFMTYETDKKFDVISFQHSLEHFPFIKNALEKAIGLLDDNGILNIIIPVTDMWIKHINTWAHINTYHLGEHRVLYPSKVLFDMLGSLGMVHQVLQENIDGTGTIWICATRKK